jgi:hypothetical protein
MRWLSLLGPHFAGAFSAGDLAELTDHHVSQFFRSERAKFYMGCERCSAWEPGCGLVPDYARVKEPLTATTPVPAYCSRNMLGGPVEIPFSELLQFEFRLEPWVKHLRQVNQLMDKCREFTPDLYALGVTNHSARQATAVFIGRGGIDSMLADLDGRLRGQLLFIDIDAEGVETNLRNHAVLLPAAQAFEPDFSIDFKAADRLFTAAAPVITPHVAARVFTHENPEGREVDAGTLRELRDQRYDLFVDLVEGMAYSEQVESVDPKLITALRGRILADLMSYPNHERLLGSVAAERTISMALAIVDPQPRRGGRTHRRWFKRTAETEYIFKPSKSSYCLIASA